MKLFKMFQTAFRSDCMHSIGCSKQKQGDRQLYVVHLHLYKFDFIISPEIYFEIQWAIKCI